MSTIEVSKESVRWLMDKVEECQDRYIESEVCLKQLMDMPWWKFILFGKKKARQHLINALNKYEKPLTHEGK